MTVKDFCKENNLELKDWGFEYNSFTTWCGKEFSVNYHDSGRITGIHEVVKKPYSVCYNCSKQVPFNYNFVDEVGCFCDECI
jgi:hypothetical protein